MNSNKALIDEETLEQVAYGRSKWWSSFLKEVNETNQVIHVDDIENVYGNDAAEGDWTDFDEAEEASEDAADGEVLDVTTAEERKSLIESTEVQDMLNATMPVLKEHQRKWEAAGLEGVLKTFDRARIEQEVGGWIRRHHNATQNPNRYTTAIDSEDSGSLLSSEAADYIRSTRKKSNTQRRRSCMDSIGRFKKFHKIHHNHGTVIETTTYRAYNCMCGKYNMNDADRSGQWHRLSFAQQHGRADTICNVTQFKKRFAMLPQTERKSWHLSRESSSSSDSDFVAHENHTLLKSIRQKSHVTESFGNKHSEILCHNGLPLPERRAQYVPMTGSKFETPPKKTLNKFDFTKTAPCKVSKKRQAAKAALKKFCKKTVPISDESSSASEDNDETFKRNLEMAIALSMKAQNKKRKNKTSLSTTTGRDSSIDSIKGAVLASSIDTNKLKGTATPLHRNILSKKLNSLNIDNIDTKENTFLTNLGNICNSTALNNAAPAARQQLPTMNENMQTVPESIERVSSKSESSITSSMRESNIQKTDHPTTLNMPPIVMATSPAEEHISGTPHSVNKSALKTKFKRNSFGSARKSSNIKAIKKPQKGESQSISTTDQTNQDSSSDASFKSNSDTVITGSLIKNNANQDNNALARKKRRDSSSDSMMSAISASSSDKIITKNTPTTAHPKSRTSNNLKKLKHNKEDTKKNTFLTNQGNMCNSAALNNVAAARQQLPTIGENTGKLSKELRKKSMGGKKNEATFNYTAFNNSSAYKEFAVTTTPSKKHSTLVHTSQHKHNTVGIPRKSAIFGGKNVTPAALNAEEKGNQKSLSLLEVNTKPKRILVYKPPPQIENTSNGSIQVTREILSGVIGDKDAQRFLKYNLKALTFPKTSAVYFCPPEVELSSSDSDDDPLEKVGLCGELCASD